MLIGLLWLAQVAVFAVGLFGPWRDPPELHNPGRVARPIRIGIALSLVVAAVLIWLAGAGRASVYAGWVAVGMAASFIGDLVMARLIPVPSRLIGGMVAFGIGHLLYIAGYRATVGEAGVAVSGLSLGIGSALYGAVTVLGWQVWIRNPSKPAALNAGALTYGLLISTMAAHALQLACAVGGGYWLAAIGGVIFIASDFLIGLSEIGGKKIENVNDWIWLTYIAGQMGIVYAGWLA